MGAPPQRERLSSIRELSFWCSTCPFLFDRFEGSNTTHSIERLRRTLADGLPDIDEQVVEAFSPPVRPGEYVLGGFRIDAGEDMAAVARNMRAWVDRA